jgi:hypothetical protein
MGGQGRRGRLGSAQVQWAQQIEQRAMRRSLRAPTRGRRWAQFDVPKAEHTLRRFDGRIPPVDPEGVAWRILDTIKALIRMQVGTQLSTRLSRQWREGGCVRRDAAVALHGRIGAQRMPIRKRLTAPPKPLATAAGQLSSAALGT